MIGQQALQLALRYTAMRRERRSQERRIARPAAPPDGAIVLGSGAHRGDPATPRQFALDSKVTTLLACLLSVPVTGIKLCSGGTGHRVKPVMQCQSALATMMCWLPTLHVQNGQQAGSPAPASHSL